MNDNDKEIVVGVLSQQKQVDFRLLAQALKPELEPDQITRAMIESARLRWKGVQNRLGIAPAAPTTPIKNAAPKKEGRGAGTGKGRKRKADVDVDSSEPPSPSKKKDKGQAKAAVVKLERSDKEDRAFDDAIFGMDMRHYEV